MVSITREGIGNHAGGLFVLRRGLSLHPLRQSTRSEAALNEVTSASSSRSIDESEDLKTDSARVVHAGLLVSSLLGKAVLSASLCTLTNPRPTGQYHQEVVPLLVQGLLLQGQPASISTIFQCGHADLQGPYSSGCVQWQALQDLFALLEASCKPCKYVPILLELMPLLTS